jgi:hypothetical protein
MGNSIAKVTPLKAIGFEYQKWQLLSRIREVRESLSPNG